MNLEAIELKGCLLVIALALVTLMSSGCKPSAETTTPQNKVPVVVTTTTMLTDLAREIGGDKLDIQGLLTPGGDPHLYKPTPGDAKLIARSDLVLTHGLKLEGWMDNLVRNVGGESEVVVTTSGIKPYSDPQKTGYPDPHSWHDVSLWQKQAENVCTAFVGLDPANAETYRSRKATYLKTLKTLDDWVKLEVAKIPASKRYLVTSHDAFRYFGERYGLKVVAVQGVSTDSEAGARDIARVVELVRSQKIPAVFIESSVSPKLVEQISRETGAKVGGILYSDALGAAGSGAANYEGMIRANTALIVKGLTGSSEQVK